MTIGELSYQGINVSTAYTSLANAGIQADVARDIVGLWIGDSIRRGRTFGYSHTFNASEPACEPMPFAREFVHADWVDGESAVQAGQSPTEDGFNERFHRIERDLDRLGALMAQAATCMSAMRATLAGSLTEIASELNRINGDIAGVRPNLTAPTPTGPIGRGFQFVGKTKYFDKSVMVWQDTDGKLINLPDAETISLPPTAETRAPKAAEVIGRDADIRAAFTGPVTKGELVARFGDRPTQDGQKLSDVLATIPDTQSFANLDAMVAKLGDQDVSLLKGIGADTKVRASVGLQPGAAATEADVAQLEGVSPALSAALAAANVKTVAQLSALTPERVLEIGTAKGIPIERGAAAGLLARGRVISNL